MASPQPRIGVVTYPGSQDDRDALWALAALDAEAVPVWHEEGVLPDVDAVVLPGGFSYGDYLRCGAVARFSPATAATCRRPASIRPRSSSATSTTRTARRTTSPACATRAET